MRVTVERDGKTTEVDVADDLSSATVEGRSYPVTVVARSPLRVELTVAGERVVVENWPEHFADPPEPVDVNGERAPVRVDRHASAAGPGARERPAPIAPPAPEAPAPPGGGIPVAPPMPGRVIEVRVREGERVRKGDVLLVLEAMKMRNEVPSPADGTVEQLKVAAGASVRAKEPMLFVRPG